MRINEILVLHHSHLDIGYTHSQPILWELQREYLDLALDMLEETADWPADSQPKWTCEVTTPVIRWLETASEQNVARFKRFIAEGRLGISGMAYNTTPLCNAEQLARQIYHTHTLRQKLGAQIVTLNQHDVNGIPWSISDLMLDSGIELLIMAINIHFGTAAAPPRPGVFRWQTPSGREILVMNGNHYTMFDQLLYTWDNSVARMREGLDTYTAFLESRNYPHDFLYLTGTNPPGMWDNSPPNMAVARLVREWNEAGNQPRIRYVTSADLLERIKQIPRDQLPLQQGDWTDYWNFGAASTAYETRLNQGSKPILATAELLEGARGATRSAALKDVSQRAWEALNLYDEHTWGYHNTAPGHPHGKAQDRLKTINAYMARELADYLLAHELEALAGNPAEFRDQEGVLLVNSTGATRTEYIHVPESWRQSGKRLRAQQFTYTGMYYGNRNAPLHGPIELAPYSWKRVPLSELAPAANDERIHITAGQSVRQRSPQAGFSRSATAIPATIETPYHRLSYSPDTGRILSLMDLQQNWEVLDQNSEFTLFEYVREHTDALIDNRREAIYDRDGEKEKIDGSCWKPGWRAIRERATRPNGCTIERGPASVTLVLSFEAPGVAELTQRITLHADTPLIDMEASFVKPEYTDPEGIYFALPLNLPAGWRSHFDTGGLPLELDAEQLPRASRDYVTVESFVSVHTSNQGVTLYCPDAPMVQVGGFNFGKMQETIARNEHPLLLAWPMNNYWNTNFPVNQAGPVSFRYVLSTHGAFNTEKALLEAQVIATPLFEHPAHQVETGSAGRLLDVSGPGVVVRHAKLAEDGRGMIVRLANVGTAPVQARVSLGDTPVGVAWHTSALEEDQQQLTIANGAAEIMLAPRRITTVRLCR